MLIWTDSESAHGKQSKVQPGLLANILDDYLALSRCAESTLSLFQTIDNGYQDLKLSQSIYRKTTVYGHFGRDDIEFPWERTDKAEELKKAAGL